MSSLGLRKKNELMELEEDMVLVTSLILFGINIGKVYTTITSSHFF